MSLGRKSNNKQLLKFVKDDILSLRHWPTMSNNKNNNNNNNNDNNNDIKSKENKLK